MIHLQQVPQFMKSAEPISQLMSPVFSQLPGFPSNQSDLGFSSSNTFQSKYVSDSRRFGSDFGSVSTLSDYSSKINDSAFRTSFSTPQNNQFSVIESESTLHNNIPSTVALPTKLAVRDSEWLKFGVCQAYMNSLNSKGAKTSVDTNGCPFPINSCPLAHPQPNVKIEQDLVTVCFDFIKRSDCRHAKCKYYHPPPYQIKTVLKRGDVNKKTITIFQQPNQLNTPLACSTSGLCWPSAQPPNLLPASLSSGLFPTVTASANNGLSANTQAVNMAMLAAAAAAMRSCQNPAFLTFPGNQPNLYANQGISSALTQLALQNDPCLSNFNGLYQLPSSTNAAALLSNDLFSLPPGGGIPPSFLATSSQQQQQYTTPALYAAAMAATARQNLPLASFTDQLSLSIDRSATATSSITTVAASPMTNNSNSTQVAGRKREAESVDGSPSAETFMPWLPPKRALQTDESSENQTVSVNGFSVGNRPDFYSLQNQLKSPECVISSVPLSFAASSTSNAFGYQMAPTSLSQTPYSGYHSQVDVANQLVNALAFNNLLQQQTQNQQQQRLSLQDLNQPVGGVLQLGMNQIPSNVAGGALSFPQLQQQQQLYLTLLRLQALAQQQQQQAQLTALAVAAGGYSLPAHSTQLSNLVPGLTTGAFPANLTDPRLQTAAAISANPYSTNMLQNQSILTNVAYINEEGQMLESLPICRDFKAGKCHRNADCRYVHILDENVEVNQGRVTVCRDAAKGRCTRVPCKYYHIPLLAISANRSLALNSALSTNGVGTASL